MSSDAERKVNEIARMEAIDAKIIEAEEIRRKRCEENNPAWAFMDDWEYKNYLAQHTDHYN